jgi:argininosuccinate lyase
MSRFGEEQDPLFRRINSSISFDWRLGSFDIEQSKAHARTLARLGVLDEDELTQISEGSTGSVASSIRGPSSSARTTRTSTWRSSGASPS